jgi:ATP phosphoribosyltransferase
LFDELTHLVHLLQVYGLVGTFLGNVSQQEIILTELEGVLLARGYLYLVNSLPSESVKYEDVLHVAEDQEMPTVGELDCSGILEEDRVQVTQLLVQDVVKVD